MSTPGASVELSSVARIDDAGGVDLVDDAGAPGDDGHAGIARDVSSMPVPTSGASARISGTA